MPILFVGERSTRTRASRACNVGADVFLARPLTNEEIVAQVAR